MKTIKLEYIPGNRPAPMIMVQNQINQNVYNEKYENELGKWNNDKSTTHFWSINVYIIIKNNEIISYRYNEVVNLKRIEFGSLKLDERLKEGEFRDLTNQEILSLL